MQVVHSADDLKPICASRAGVDDSPVLLDFFLNNAIEVDVDCVSRWPTSGDWRHYAARGAGGVSLGDSGCSLPPYSLSEEVQDEIRRQTWRHGRSLGVVGLMNAAICPQDRAWCMCSRGQPARQPHRAFCVQSHQRAAGQKWAHAPWPASACKTQGIEAIPDFYAVKEAVFPFIKFPGVDTILGPEMTFSPAK